MSEISFQQAKKLTLDRLNQWLLELPVSERNRPRIVIDFKTYSVNDLIVQVERETVVGKDYIYKTAKQGNYVVT